MPGVIVITPDELEQLLERTVERVMSRVTQTEILSVSAAARRAERSGDTVRGWIASGALPAAKRGRVWAIRREDLDRYLAGERKDAGPCVSDIVASLIPKVPS